MALEEIASRLIAFDTTSAKSNVGACAFLAELLESAGMRVTLQEEDFFGVKKANLLASMGPPVAGGLLISGHVDTVPFEGQAGWTRDPLVMRRERDRVYGRGTSDMKTFLAQCVAAAGALDSVRLARPLVFGFTYDEEVGFGGASRLAPHLGRLLADVPLPRIGWIGEPTSGRIFHAHKGSVVFQIAVRGRAVHSGTPELGINAIGAAGRVLEVIGVYERELAARSREGYEDLFPGSAFPTLSVGIVRGGTSINTVPDDCVLGIYCRPLPGDDPLEAYHELARRLTSAEVFPYGRGAGAAEVELGPPFTMPGMLATRDPVLEAALSTAMGTHGSTGAPFGTDGCMLAAAGIDCLICGPGDVEEAHRPNESISRRAYEGGTDAIVSVVQRVCC